MRQMCCRITIQQMESWRRASAAPAVRLARVCTVLWLPRRSLSCAMTTQ